MDLLFKRGYVTAPQCTPSRAGLMTGQYQNRFGVEHNGLVMRGEVVTLPERLKAAGYVTGISGKWHLDCENQTAQGGRKNVVHLDLGPWGQGFDEYFAGFMQDYEASHALDNTPYPDAPKKVREEGCRVDLQTEWALQFLKRRATETKNKDQGAKDTAKPFFLNLSYMAPASAIPGTARSTCPGAAERACSARAASACPSSPPGPAKSPTATLIVHKGERAADSGKD